MFLLKDKKVPKNPRGRLTFPSVTTAVKNELSELLIYFLESARFALIGQFF